MTPLRPGAGPRPLRTATRRADGCGAAPGCQPVDTLAPKGLKLSHCADETIHRAHRRRRTARPVSVRSVCSVEDSAYFASTLATFLPSVAAELARATARKASWAFFALASLPAQALSAGSCRARP